METGMQKEESYGGDINKENNNNDKLANSSANVSNRRSTDFKTENLMQENSLVLKKLYDRLQESLEKGESILQKIYDVRSEETGMQKEESYGGDINKENNNNDKLANSSANVSNRRSTDFKTENLMQENSFVLKELYDQLEESLGELHSILKEINDVREVCFSHLTQQIRRRKDLSAHLHSIDEV